MGAAAAGRSDAGDRRELETRTIAYGVLAALSVLRDGIAASGLAEGSIC